mgnify:CR=1 FL=1|jgi:hypothetical protein
MSIECEKPLRSNWLIPEGFNIFYGYRVSFKAASKSIPKALATPVP